MERENKEVWNRNLVATSVALWLNRIYAGGLGATIGATIHSAPKEDLLAYLGIEGAFVLAGALNAVGISFIHSGLKDGDKKDLASSNK